MNRAVVVVAAVSFCAVCFGGCVDDADCNATEPQYAGAATDEVWRVMLDARSNAKDTTDVEIVVPQPGDEVKQGDGPLALAWDSSLVAAALPNVGPASSAPRRGHRRPARGLIDELSNLVFPTALAHKPPITSDVYFVEVDVPGRTCPVAALTTLESLLFSDGDWDEVTKEPGERTLRILSAFVTENRITEGPFAAAPVTFSVVQ